MKLKKYREYLNWLAEKYPNYDELEVVYARDDEGNGFQKFNNTPTPGHFEGDYHGEFIAEDEFHEYEKDELYGGEELSVNAICIN